MWAGIIQSTEGLNRTKRQRKGLGHPSLALRHWHSCSSSLQTQANIYPISPQILRPLKLDLHHWLPWFSGLWTQTKWHHQLFWFSRWQKMVDFLASRMLRASFYNKSLYINLYISYWFFFLWKILKHSSFLSFWFSFYFSSHHLVFPMGCMLLILPS